MGTTCQPCTHIHRNLARPCPWEPCATPLFSTISNIPLLGFFFLLFFFSRIFMCELFRLILSPLGRDYEHFTTISNIHLLDFFFFFFPQGSFCVGCLGLFCPRWVGTMNTSTLSLHTTMSSDTTCWGDKYLGELPWVINITYKDTF